MSGEIIITLDASELIKAFKLGLEEGFILANQTPELEEQLNVNKIDAKGI